MPKYKHYLGVLSLTITSLCFAAPPPLVDELLSCAGIVDTQQRLACYDALSSNLKGANEQAATAASPEDQDTAVAAAMPDSIGGGAFSPEEQQTSYRGRVTSCKKSADRRWFYIFENGQVWKQVDRRKRRHKTCDFQVTLSKDNFGYTMMIDNQDAKIRVDRRR